MAAKQGRLKPSGMLSYRHPLIFKRFILQFVRSLGKDDRAAFRFYCTNEIPRGKLDIDVHDDGDIFKLIEFLQNDNKLSFSDMSLLKHFLLAVERFDLLESLEKVELRIAIGIILEDYSVNSNNLHQGSDIAYNLYADIVEFLISTREKSQELISQTLEKLRQAGEDYSVDGVIQECQLKPKLSWPVVTALLVIVAELYSEAEDVDDTIELLAEWILKLDGLKAFERFIRKKAQCASKDCAISSIRESLEEYLKLIGHEVDKE